MFNGYFYLFFLLPLYLSLCPSSGCSFFIHFCFHFFASKWLAVWKLCSFVFIIYIHHFGYHCRKIMPIFEPLDFTWSFSFSYRFLSKYQVFSFHQNESKPKRNEKKLVQILCVLCVGSKKDEKRPIWQWIVYYAHYARLAKNIISCDHAHLNRTPIAIFIFPHDNLVLDRIGPTEIRN